MSFNIALSGIAAAQKDLDSTANNISNVNTIGFKESRAEFADVFANSLFTNAKTKVGDGVATSAIAQQFHQGSLNSTKNSLDLAINGNGFFATAPDLESKDMTFTRAGAFRLNGTNHIVDSQGNFLQAFPVNADGSSSSVSLSTTQPIKIPETAGQPVKTSEVAIELNLDQRATPKDVAKFDHTNEDTYFKSTSVTIYDSLGQAHVQTTYFVKPLDAAYTDTNHWAAFVTVDGKPVNVWDTDPDNNPATNDGAATAGQYQVDVDGDDVKDDLDNADGDNNTATGNTDAGVFSTAPAAPGDFVEVVSTVFHDKQTPVPAANRHTGFVLTFDSVGALKTVNGTSPGTITLQALGVDDPSNPAASDGANVLAQGADGSQRITMKFDGSTQYASTFQTTSLDQDGLTVGRLTGIDIGADGLVKATYSNGTSQALARVAMVRLKNEQGMSQVGNTSWKATQDSGDAIAGEANSGSYGAIKSASLEQSNVNLTTELVDLISAQRNFQANSRALEVNSTLQQTVLQIR